MTAEPSLRVSEVMQASCIHPHHVADAGKHTFRNASSWICAVDHSQCKGCFRQVSYGQVLGISQLEKN